LFFFFSSRRRHTRLVSDWSSDVCSSDLTLPIGTAETTNRIASSQCFFQKSTWNSGSNRLFMKPIAVGSATLPSCLPTSTQSRPPIGRAACRGRGGGAGVGERLTKKREHE